MSAAQIIAQLSAATQKLDETQAKLRSAQQDALQARQLIATALEGSSAQLTGQIDSLVDILSQVAGRTPAVNDQVKKTITKVQALGN
ncbi:DUF6244 family protein [Solwaraspora sp. WMMD1047]|uniref:DUF6244 family protein n=1 Tax=Solwaraspora sp. WMMD1047 TaxID=3016102 RepID=UPI002416D63B|nr:DUF6244 family protein [Solwaraspora sp. WMMD1047]MDG4831636.1 DUF6244 family protein [Solwaraspora sp. WMMD1047]